MKLLTADGQLQRARSFPMQGLDAHQLRSPSSSAIPLGRLPSGETRMLAISRVYRTNPIVMACCHLIARGLSRVPLRTYRMDRNAKGEPERVMLRADVPPGPGRPNSGAALAQLARMPAPRLSRRRLIFRSALDVGIFGNAVAAFDWGLYGPTELWPIPWRRCVVHLTDPMTITQYDAWGAQGRVTLDPQHVVHWTWGDDPESPIGVSPIESLQFTIALHNAIDRHLISYYGNAARPSGVLKLARMPKGDDVEKIREQFKQLYTAPENAGNVVLTSGDYTPIAEQTGVPTLAELIRLSRQEILSVYGVDPPMIGIYENAIKSNFQEGREKHVMDTLGPWADLWESEANVQMVWQNPLWAYHYWEFDLAERIRPDLAALADIMVKMQTTMTTNERRAFLHLPRLEFPEADVPFAASGTFPMNAIPTTVTEPQGPGGPAALGPGDGGPPALDPGTEETDEDVPDPDDEDED